MNSFLMQREESFNIGFLLFLVLLTAIRVVWLQATSLDLYGDEAQYWIWSKNLAWGYYSKPPVLAHLIALTTSICGDSEACVRLSSPILHFINSILIYVLGKEVFDRTIGLWSGLLYATMPAIFLSSWLISTDPALLTFWMLSMLFFIKALKDDGLKFWILAGIAAGLGMLTKYSMLLFLLSVVLYLVTSKRVEVLKSKGFWIAAFTALIIFTPNIIWNIENGMPSFGHHYDLAKGRADQSFSPIGFLKFLGAQFGVFGPILFAYFLYMLVGYVRKHEEYKMLWIFALTFLVIISIVSFVSRAHANWAAPAYVAAMLLVVHHSIATNRTWVIKASFLLHLLAGTLAMSYPIVIKTLDIELTKKTDAFRRLRGSKELGMQLDDLRAEFPNAVFATDDRKSYAAFVYYTKPHAFDLVKWNLGFGIKDHFALTTNMNDHIGKDVIVLTKWGNEARYKTYAKSVKEVGVLKYNPYAGHDITFRAYYLKEFKGY